jgi:hypothetical protein
MIAFAPELPATFAIYRTHYNASGEAGRAVEKQLTAVRRSFDSSVAQSGNRLRMLDALDKFVNGAMHENWDGEGGLPVSWETFINARRFLEQIPVKWRPPEVNADPDGEISLEWSAGPRRRFSVSIGPEERISYAWLSGAERGHSVNTFVTEIPRQFLDHVDQVLSQ